MAMDVGRPRDTSPHTKLLHRPFKLVPKIPPRKSGPASEFDDSEQGSVGFDIPLPTLDAWLSDFEQLRFKPEVSQQIMLDSTRKLLGLGAA